MPEPISPLAVFISAAGLSALAGLAALLRSGKPVTWLSVTSAVMNSGAFGLAIATLWYKNHEDDVFYLLGTCILSGLAGSTAVDLVIDAVKKNGIGILGIKLDDDKGPD